jgi:low temperature requirement protein LtrA
VTQWLRAARSHPGGRPGTLRYAAGVTLIQVFWIGRLWLHGPPGMIVLVVLGLAELSVPVWAEFAGRPTPWHAGHITERYGDFTIIVLGEVVAAIATGVDSAQSHSLGSPGLLTAAAAGLVLVFTMWWSYFKHSAAERIRESLRWTFAWAIGHYLIFGCVAALGAGLQVVVATLAHTTRVGPVFAAFTVAIPLAVYSVMLGLLTTRTRSELGGLWLVLLAAALVLAAAAAAAVLTLPGSIVAMTVLAVLVLAYHLARAPRTTAQPEQVAP